MLSSVVLSVNRMTLVVKQLTRDDDVDMDVVIVGLRKSFYRLVVTIKVFFLQQAYCKMIYSHKATAASSYARKL